MYDNYVIKHRSVIVCFLLNIITFGIYGIYLFYKIGNEINMLCDGDDARQMNYVGAWFLGLVTFGIYPLIWCVVGMYRLRMVAGKRFGKYTPYTGISYAMWLYPGMFLFFVGSIIAFHHFIAQINCFAGVAPSEFFQEEEENRVLNEAGNMNGNFGGINSNVDEIPPTTPGDGYFPERKPGKIVCLKGTYEGAEFPMQDGDEYVIGTNADMCNIVIDSSYSTVSRRHCSIKYNSISKMYMVVDYSTNGTYLENGSALYKNAPKMLPTGTVIKIGDDENIFRIG